MEPLGLSNKNNGTVGMSQQFHANPTKAGPFFRRVVDYFLPWSGNWLRQGRKSFHGTATFTESSQIQKWGKEK